MGWHPTCVWNIQQGWQDWGFGLCRSLNSKIGVFGASYTMALRGCEGRFFRSYSDLYIPKVCWFRAPAIGRNGSKACIKPTPPLLNLSDPGQMVVASRVRSGFRGFRVHRNFNPEPSHRPQIEQKPRLHISPAGHATSIAKSGVVLIPISLRLGRRFHPGEWLAQVKVCVLSLLA